MIGGGAVAVLGVVGYVVSDGKHQEFEDAKLGGGRIDMTQTEAKALERASHDWWLVGTIASGVGAAALVTGVVLLVVDDGGADRGTDAHANVTAAPLPGGAVVGIETAF